MNAEYQEAFNPLDAPAPETGDDAPDAAEDAMDATKIAEDIVEAVENMVSTDEIVEYAYKRDVAALPRQEIEEQLRFRGLDDSGRTKAELVGRLWTAIEAANATPELGEASVKMNLHRMKQLFLHLYLRWNGSALGWDGGGSVRQSIVDKLLSDTNLKDRFCASFYVRAARDGEEVDGPPPWDEDAAIGARAASPGCAMTANVARSQVRPATSRRSSRASLALWTPSYGW